MLFNVAAVKVRTKGEGGKIVCGDSYVVFSADGRTLSKSGLSESVMASDEWEIEGDE